MNDEAVAMALLAHVLRVAMGPFASIVSLGGTPQDGNGLGPVVWPQGVDYCEVEAYGFRTDSPRAIGQPPGQRKCWDA